MKKTSLTMKDNGPGFCPASLLPLLVVAIISPPLNEDETLLVEGDSSQLLGIDRPPVSSRRSFTGGAGWHMGMALSRLDHGVAVKAFFPVNNSPQRSDHFLQDLEAAGIDTSHVRRWSHPINILQRWS
jgi:sugar/nucleoside kinase (ribokinase family)